MNFGKLSLLVAFLFLAVFSCKKKGESIKVQKGKITESVYASGYVKARNQYQAFASSAGILLETFVSEGDTVRKGDVLFSISNPLNRFNEENARLASVLASENLAADKLDELRVNLELAKARMKQDSLLFERQKKLWQSQIGSKVDVESRELGFASSKSAYLASVYRYNDAKRQLGFVAEQSNNNLQASRSLSSDNLVKSGIDGVVYSIMREKGEFVGSQIPLAVIGNAGDFFLELQVDEFDITKVKVGQPIKVKLDSYKDKVFEAKVTRVNPIMNERSRSFLVEADFTKAPEVLYPNLTIEANIILQEKAEIITVPRNYLIGDSSVLFSDEDTQRVTIGLKDYQRAEIISGIKEGDVIYKPGK